MSKKYSSLSDPKVTELLLSGKVGVIPTDTVYGLVCSAVSEEAVKRLYTIKNRQQKPGTVIAASVEQLVDMGLKKRYLTAVRRFWPGQVSVIIPSFGSLNHLHLGKNSVAARVVGVDEIRVLLEATGPLLTTSANHPGELGATIISEAQDYFGDEVDFYIDAGDLSGREASTIIRIVDDAIEVIREGAVKIDEETGRIIE